MTVKEMREKLNNLDWCDEDEIFVEFNDESYPITEVYDFAQYKQNPDESMKLDLIGVSIKVKMPQ